MKGDSPDEDTVRVVSSLRRNRTCCKGTSEELARRVEYSKEGDVVPEIDKEMQNRAEKIRYRGL